MDAFFGEIRVFPYGYYPANWLPCDGQVLSGQQFQALYAIIGTTYGSGPTANSFKIPNLNGNMVVGAGAGPGLTPRDLADTGGETAVTCTPSQFPPHNHLIKTISALGTSPNPAGNLIANDQGNKKFLAPPPSSIDFTNAMPALAPAGVATLAAHDNMQPYLPLQYCICVDGVWPPRPD